MLKMLHWSKVNTSEAEKMTVLIFTLYLLSGTGGVDVIGYSGGSLIMYFNYQLSGEHTKYFCKENNNNPNAKKECIFIQPNPAQVMWGYKDKVFLHDNPGSFTVIYTQLSLQDAGTYQCGGNGLWNYDVRLKINTDPCCVSPKTVIGYLGETLTISCSYPDEIKDTHKYFFKINGPQITQMIATMESKKDRFSITDDKSSKHVSIRISDVREEDGGVYSCGVGIGGQTVNYYTLFPEIHLQVTAFRTAYRPTLIAPTTVPSDEGHFNSSSSVIITVCFCVVLLLIGGPALIFYILRCKKTQDSFCCSITGRNDKTDADYENDPPGNQNNIRLGQVYQNRNQSHPFYQDLDDESRDADSFYHSLNPDTSQIQSSGV